MDQTRHYLRLPLAVLAATIVLLQSGCSAFGIRTAEEAGYSILDQQGQFQLREYDALLVAETWVDSAFEEAGRTAFGRLFGYISGDNVSAMDIAMTAPVMALQPDPANGEEIAMTTPVTSEKSGSGWRFAFVLPSTFSFENTPLPTNDKVKLAAIPAKKVAVLRYSGSWSEATYETNLQLLRQWMLDNNLEADSQPRIAGYDPPWTLPFLRRNEVMIDVKSRG